MQIRTFAGSSIKEALRQVREQLGTEAVILETRQCDDGRHEKFEVRAGVNESDRGEDVTPLFPKADQRFGAAAYQQAEKTEPVAPPKASKGKQRKTPEQAESVTEELKALRREVKRMTLSPQPAFEDQTNGQLTELGRHLDQGLSETTDLLRAVLAEVRCQGGMGFSPAQARLYSLLTYNGVEDVLAEDMVRSLEGFEADDHQGLRRALARDLLQRIQLAPPLSRRPGKRVVAFLGPTGVGKTTTIAKIAADATIRFGRKVGLITLDTYRIAAVEQLAAYSEIMGLELKVARSVEELRKAIAALASCDLILIDSAGRNPKDERALTELGDLLDGHRATDRVLCLAAGTNPRTLAEITRAFSPLNYRELVITKMDECVGHGSILNAHLRTDRPLTYFTTGQRVPEDIEPATAERLVRLILEQWNP
ncbi:MAG: flagellar biosynthesis protein FlhF [Myxococcales bacterium]|nr:flagellar biosynthesis protein FlhF [Myxococcales bacterium]